MKSRDFVYWLQGYFEISGANELNEEQVNVIKNHLGLVFVHEIDPEAEQTTPKDTLDAAHGGDVKYRC